MRRCLLLAVGALLALPANAWAAEIVREDREGRPMRFDVRVGGTDVDWFAGLLRRAAHADEIADVTVRLVSRNELASTCGRFARGCYRLRHGGAGVVVVSAERSASNAHTFLHEYGHHVDRGLSNGRLREPNGGRFWWQARGMARLRALRSVASNYRLGWDRSVAEIFAEDYARITVGGRFRISWLRPPDAFVRRAILADLGLTSPPAGLPREPQVRNLLLSAAGTLEPGERETLRFGLLGPGRRAVFTARLSGPDTRGRLEITCAGRARSRPLAPGQGSATLDVRNLPPGRCTASVVSTTAVAVRFDVRLRVSLPV